MGIFNSRKILRNSNFSKIFVLIFTFTYLLNLRFPLLGGFISELLIFVLILIKRFLILNFILLLAFVLPIIFTFSTIIIFSKFYSLNFNNFSLYFSNLLSFRILLISVFLVYSCFIL